MTIASNTITLKAGRIYKLIASFSRLNGGASPEFTYQFRDTTNNVDLGGPGALGPGGNNGWGGIAEALVVVPTTGDISVQLWSKKNINGATTLDANSGSNAGAVIVQQVAGFSPILGTTVEYIEARAGVQAVTP